MEVYIENENQQPLGPGEFKCIPVEYASNALIRFKPAISSSHYNWSLREVDLSQLQASIGNHITKCPSIYPTDSYFFLVDINGDKEGFDRYLHLQIYVTLVATNTPLSYILH
jgi:hypothetical protein